MIECEPVVSVDVDSVACPALSVPVPMVVVPSRNATVPVGVELPLTVAVKVTVWPAVDGFTDEITTVLVGTPFTVCVNAAETLLAKVASPEYVAVIECEPALNVLESVAWPPALSVLVPIVVPPSRNATEPVGVPGELLLTVAVKATDCPAMEGFMDEVTTVVVAAPVAASSKRYAVIKPVSGLLPEPVMLEVASWPSVAKT